MNERQFQRNVSDDLNTLVRLQRERERRSVCADTTQGGNMTISATYFQRSITEKGLVPTGIDPRHLEAYIRLQYSTLGHLSWPEIKREVKVGLACIKVGGVAAAERCAQSFGL
jgi:hypothetical protein